MAKISFDSLSGRCTGFLHRGSVSSVLELNNNLVIKLFNPDALRIFKSIGVDIEGKVLDSENQNLNKQIKKPKDIVYRDAKFCGYTMERICGDDIYYYCSNLPQSMRYDLNYFANLYYKVEEIIKSEDNLVFPDLCTFGNVVIINGKPIVLDYDGIQVGKYLSGNISSSLGNQSQYDNSKYRDGDYFTKELDIKSLVTLYFACTFGVNLSVVGEHDPITGTVITLDEIFDLIDLDDDDMKHKVWKTFDNSSKNEYLGNDVFKLSERHKLIPIDNDKNFKMLIKK